MMLRPCLLVILFSFSLMILGCGGKDSAPQTATENSSRTESGLKNQSEESTSITSDEADGLVRNVQNANSEASSSELVSRVRMVLKEIKASSNTPKPSEDIEVTAKFPKPPAPGNLSPLPPKANQIDLSYIPADCTSVFIIQPRRIIEHKLVRFLLKLLNKTEEHHARYAHKQLVKHGNGLSYEMKLLTLMHDLDPYGLTYDTTEDFRIIACSDQHPAESNEDDSKNKPRKPAAQYVRAAIPLNIEDILRNPILSFDDNFEIRNLDGIPFIAIEDSKFGIAFPSEKEMISGELSTVENMLKAGRNPSHSTEFFSRLKKQDNPMLLLASVAPDFMENLGLPVTNAITKSLNIVISESEELDSLSLKVDLDSPKLVSMEFMAPSTDDAKRISKNINEQIESTQSSYKPMTSQMLKAGDTEPANMLEDFLSSLAFTQDGKTTLLTANPPEKADQLLMVINLIIEKHRNDVLSELKSLERRIRIQGIGLAMHNYYEDHKRLPVLHDSGHRGLSWRVHLLPYFDKSGISTNGSPAEQLYAQFHLDEPWDSPHNKKLIKRMPDFYGENKDGKTRLHLLNGEGTPFQNGRKVNFSDISDSPSKTILCVEAGADKAEFWTKPGGLKINFKDPLKSLGNADPVDSGFYVVMIDASSRILPFDLPRDTIRRLMQHADGESLEDFEFPD